MGTEVGPCVLTLGHTEYLNAYITPKLLVDTLLGFGERWSSFGGAVAWATLSN